MSNIRHINDIGYNLGLISYHVPQNLILADIHWNQPILFESMVLLGYGLLIDMDFTGRSSEMKMDSNMDLAGFNENNIVWVVSNIVWAVVGSLKWNGFTCGS